MMRGEGEFANVPSGIESGATDPSGYQKESGKQGGFFSSNAAIWAVAMVALLLSASSLYLSLSGQAALSSQTRTELKSIAEDLRSIQQKDITLSSPLKTTAYVEQSFPASDIFPPKFDVNAEGQVHIEQETEGIMQNGIRVPIYINTTIPAKMTVPVEAGKTLTTTRLTIKKEVPIDTRLTATMKVQAVYGKELNGIIDKLENMAGEK